jgi:cytoskeletal protein CcmA (bactofilin family)
MVVLMVALISGALISLAHLQRVQFDDNVHRQEILRNTNSAFQYILAQEKELEQTFDLFGNGRDSVLVKKINWGLFDVLYAQAFRHTLTQKYQHSKVALMGSAIQDQQKSALYLIDNFRPLSLVGKTRIEGTAYLPKAGVKRGYINGLSYFGDKLIYGEQKRSNRSLPPINQERIQQLKNIAIQNKGISNISDSITQSFGQPTLEIYSPTVYLKNQILKGNIIIRSDSIIYVGKAAKLENVLLFAPNIIFESGFEGSVQAFATNSILLQEQSKLTYPSVILLTASRVNENADQTGIIMKPKSELEGTLLNYSNLQSRSKSILVNISTTALIKGELISNTKIELQGNVHGHVSTAGFIYQSPASIFDNHLFNVEISFDKRFQEYVSSNWHKNLHLQKMVQWLE